MAAIRQTSFARGEFSPLLWGRSDLDIYSQGLRRCRNFFITKQGAAMSRPGTLLVRETKSGSSGPAVRLVPFTFSDTVSYVLEFGALASGSYIRFHTNGGTVESAPGVPYEVATTYAAADLPELRWAQSGNVLTVACPGHPPRELARVRASQPFALVGDWTLTDISFARPTLFQLIGATAVVRDSTTFAGDVDHIPREWQWAVTGLRRDDRGIVTESAPYIVWSLSTGAAVPDSIAVYPDKPVTLEFPSVGGLGIDPHVIGLVVYRGRGGLFGLIGHTDTNTFTDVGDDPDYARAPPQGHDPFKVYDAAGTLVRTEYPTAVGYFEERRVFAGTAERPAFLFFSTTGDYSNFDERLIPVADEALTYELASRRREDIRHVVGLQRLLVFTSSSAWDFGGAGGEALAPDSVSARVQVEIGTTPVPPLTIDGAVLFVRNKGAGVRALTYENERQGFVSVDVSFVAEHLLFSGALGASTIVDWCYAEDPFGVIWAVRADGKLLSLTYTPDGAVSGWALHETDGTIKAICSVPENGEDVVYLCVHRNGVRVIERMTSRVVRGTIGTDNLCVDCGIQYAGVPVQTLTGLGLLEGKYVYVLSDENPVYGPLLVQGGQVTLPEMPVTQYSSLILTVGLLYMPELETLDAAPNSARGNQKSTTAVFFEVNQSKGLYAGQDLDHLVEWRQRTVASNYGVPSAATELVKVNVRGTWDTGARAALRQTLPLPVTVVGLTREVDVGGN